MELFKIYGIYLVFLTICVNAETQTTDTSEKNKDDTTHKVGRKKPVETKKVIREMPFKVCADPKEQKPNSKFMKIPINVVISNKPRTLPIKIPLVIKTGNVKPAPAHYVRLKGIPERKKQFKHKSGIDANTEKLSKKVTAKDMEHPHIKSEHNHKPKSSKFYEDDVDGTFMLPVFKTSKNSQHKKVQDNSDFSTNSKTKNFTESKTGQISQELAFENVYNKPVYTKNGTHSIHIAKLPHPVLNTATIGEMYERKLDEILEDQVLHGTSLNHTSKEFEVSSLQVEEKNVSRTFTSEEIQQTLNKSNSTMPLFKEYPIVAVDTGFDVPAIITIKDRNYEEFEEKAAPLNSEPIDEIEYFNKPWPIPSLNPESTNLYNTYFQNYQTASDKYLKYLETNKPDIHNENVIYPHANPVEDLPKSEFVDILSSPETQIVQDIYEQKPDIEKNIIDVCPENSVGRIWRTWKDTEIRFIDPRYLQVLQQAINMKDIDYNDAVGKASRLYGSQVNAKAPALYGPQAVGLNRYYNKFKNVKPYSTNLYI